MISIISQFILPLYLIPTLKHRTKSYLLVLGIVFLVDISGKLYRYNDDFLPIINSFGVEVKSQRLISYNSIAHSLVSMYGKEQITNRCDNIQRNTFSTQPHNPTTPLIHSESLEGVISGNIKMSGSTSDPFEVTTER